MLMKTGFTLIELSIVLIIVSVIVGGVVGGQALIRQAELWSTPNLWSSFRLASPGAFSTPSKLSHDDYGAKRNKLHGLLKPLAEEVCSLKSYEALYGYNVCAIAQ